MMNCECCSWFDALPSEARVLNKQAREAALKGEEFPGSVNTMCASCVAYEIHFSVDGKTESSEENILSKL